MSGAGRRLSVLGAGCGGSRCGRPSRVFTAQAASRQLCATGSDGEGRTGAGGGGRSETKHRLPEQREMIKRTYARNCWRFGSS